MSKHIPKNYIDKQIEHMKSQMNRPIYCKLCGKEILYAPQDENGFDVDPVAERNHEMHYRCYLQEVERRRNAGNIQGS